MEVKFAAAAFLALLIIPSAASAYPQEELRAAVAPVIIAGSLIISLALIVSKSKSGRKMFTEAKEAPAAGKAIQRKRKEKEGGKAAFKLESKPKAKRKSR